jgi:3-oxoacyl-[acyl-carrier-protein] synthase-3
MHRSPPRIHLVGLAGITGSDTLSTEALGHRFRLSPGRITEKTGVTGLRRVGEESLLQLATTAARESLRRAGVDPSQLTAVFGSSNPTAADLLPTFTAAVAHSLGLSRIIVDHVGIGCCGGLQALRNAWNQLLVDGIQGRTSYALVVAGDQTSRILDPDRPQTGTLFGEGVSALVLTNDPAFRTGYEVQRVATCSLLGDALYALRLPNPYAHPEGPLPRLQMAGSQVFDFGCAALDTFLELLEMPSVPSDCVLVPHQPNLRMLEGMIARSHLDPRRVYVDGIRTIGNTSAPACLLGLEDALRKEQAGPANPVMLGAFGAELQVGAAWLRPVDPMALVSAPSLDAEPAWMAA